MLLSAVSRRSGIKNYFPLPNEIYQLGLSPRAVAIYGYLLSIENRETYEAYASYNTIGEATQMSRNTVRKYVAELEERGLITTERTTITTLDGRRQNGCLRYHILPIQMSLNQFYERQFAAMDLAQEQWKVQQAIKRKEARRNAASGE